ncbi:hypothetical protein FE257_010834 [Aspergillus nanangensis]|uniref:Uncharacterized protein n=1 Tax=Aspergillus nanangensis TaxID=2582783 RepID=A0AAD4CXH5_ASPNN|nr:hypothetical protein FE257_010834 [Aspergillus nanangensis]
MSQKNPISASLYSDGVKWWGPREQFYTSGHEFYRWDVSLFYDTGNSLYGTGEPGSKYTDYHHDKNGVFRALIISPDGDVTQHAIDGNELRTDEQHFKHCEWIKKPSGGRMFKRTLENGRIQMFHLAEFEWEALNTPGKKGNNGECLVM